MSSSARTAPPRALPTVRRAVAPVAAAAALALVAAGCGSGESGAEESGAAATSGVTVEGAYGEEPTVEFDTPYELGTSASRVLEEGDGETVEADDIVTLDYWVFSGTSGDQLETSRDAAPISLPLREGEAAPGILDALVGVSAGSRVLAAVAPEAPPEGASPDPAAETIVFVMDVLDVVPERAEGTAVEPDPAVPVVTTDEEGDVTGVDVEGVTPPEDLVVTTLVEGEGEPVEAGQTVTIHYEGVLASDGTVFDSSWQRDTPATFPLEGLIDAWVQGLPGVPVGSRVVLQVPPELGYKEDGNGEVIPPDADLVFVIDVLAAS